MRRATRKQGTGDVDERGEIWKERVLAKIK
jgi:hypothetical protein